MLAQLGSSPEVGLLLACLPCICLHMVPSGAEQSVSVSNSFALVFAKSDMWVLSDKDLPLFMKDLMLRMAERSQL